MTDQLRAQAAFERYVVPELPVLLRVARSLTRHDSEAEDLVQDTLLRAFRAIDGFDGRYPRAWLLTIMRNTHINAHRRKRPELFRHADEALELIANDDPPLFDDAFDAAVQTALDHLNKPFRTVVDLVDIRGLNYKPPPSSAYRSVRS